jgi:hypothetical protein
VILCDLAVLIETAAANAEEKRIFSQVFPCLVLPVLRVR